MQNLYEITAVNNPYLPSENVVTVTVQVYAKSYEEAEQIFHNLNLSTYQVFNTSIVE